MTAPTGRGALDLESPSAVGYVAGPPEALFRVGHIVGDQVAASGSMRTGLWNVGPNGEACSGSLGVLLDDALGTVILSNRGQDQWAATIEMSVNICTPMPIDGQEVTARAGLLSVDRNGGLARGEIRSAEGRVIAVGTQRVRFTSGAPTPNAPTPATARSTAPELPVLELLDVAGSTCAGSTTAGSAGGDPSVLELRTVAHLGNPAGNLHGGLSFCLSEIAGQLALQTMSPHLRTTSIHLVFARPTPLGEVIRFVPEVAHSGRTMGVARVRGIRADGKVCTIATVTAQAGYQIA